MDMFLFIIKSFKVLKLQWHKKYGYKLKDKKVILVVASAQLGLFQSEQIMFV